MSDLGDFVHLHVHSVYSTLDGANKLDKLVGRAKELGMMALALTDHGNLFGALQFQKACQKLELKPIFGSEMYLAPTSRTDRESPQSRTRHHQLLLCESLEGYRNLSRLSSMSFLEGFYYKPRIDMELLARHSQGLIATSACMQGPIHQSILSGAMSDAQRQLDDFVQIFGKSHFYLELMDHGKPEQRRINEALLVLARKHDLPLIATNDCHYLSQGDHEAHDALVCIQTGKKLTDEDRLTLDEPEYYLKSPAEMAALFGHIDGALGNTVEIAERCNVEIPTRQKLLPRYKTPNGEPAAEYLRMLVRKGLDERYGAGLQDFHRERAEHELGVIENMGFVDYFLVVWDFIDWARRRSIPVGPGRGSGAGSIVAYALGITNLDPLEHGLLFERFLNPERVSMPDFDIDFCFERRGEVIEYVRNKYGADCVAQIITFQTMKSRNSIRDAGRVLSMDLAEVDRVAKLVPGGPKPPKDLEHALEEVPELREAYDNDPRVRKLVDTARGIEGSLRQPGTHAAGVVICDQPLIDLIPLYRQGNDPEQMPATQFTMTEVEEIGLLKMDFLGLKNLTLIDKCLKSINGRTGGKLTADEIPLDDPDTYRLLQTGKGLGVFQLESEGMRQLLRDFKPTQFSDLVALISLYRPGPMQNIPDFIARKEGRQEINFDHEDLGEILQETYGLFVYQEQVMQVAQKLAGYSLGSADLLRRAMSKKKPEEMEKHRELFARGAAERGVPEAISERVWDTMESFASYGFNKSHAAAYSVITVQTAWLKTHYPVDFYAALMANEVGQEDEKLLMYFEEMRGEGIQMLPPDVNTSTVDFSADPEGRNIRFGMAAIKGVGRGMVEHLVDERERAGRFESVQDFAMRMDKKHLNARTLECLISCGALDRFGHNRPSLLAAMPHIMEVAGLARQEADAAQGSLFDMLGDEEAGGLEVTIPIPKKPDWKAEKRLETEKELAGFYLSGHPLEPYEADCAAFSTMSAAAIQKARKGDRLDWVGLIRKVTPRIDSNGRSYAFTECEDRSGIVECTFWADQYEQYRTHLKPGEMIWVRGRVGEFRETKNIIVNEMRPLDEVRAEFTRAIEIHLPWRALTEAGLTRLREIIARHKGRRRLWIVLREGEDEVRIEAGNGCGIEVSGDFIRELQGLRGLKIERLIPRHNGNGRA